MIDFSEQLNPSQLEAVTNIDGPVLVIAGAGSGKTRVIEYRVLYLLQNNVNPHSILLLTFTKRAAKEMLSRAGRHDIRCAGVEGGTFHSFAYKVLKKYSALIGFNNFTVIDESDAEEAVHIASSKCGVFNQDKRFPKKDTLKSIISMCVNKNKPVEEILESEYPNFLDYAADIEKIKQNYARYKIEKGYMDYDDLLVYLRNLLARHKEITDALSEKYKYVMVDEYQDTNLLQADIAYLLAKNNKNIMAVGDDAQSIYSFRGASHENIMDFPKRFPGCKIIKLEENYRSSQTILDVANAVLEDMRKKYPKHLIAVKRHTMQKPQLLFFNDIYEEAQWVASKIKEENDEGLAFCQQAV
ncbi:MAG: ATP-dependent helicase, partial [Candidatus Omnitrophica bacterium]|nr:ATP-dependent helicase [Candidatus Omnitrophota bacterium]